MWCKKNGYSPDSPYYTPLSQDFLSYFAFPKGSWWLYKEINSGKTDSFYVDYYKISNQKSTKGGINAQTLDYELVGEKYRAGGGAAAGEKINDTIPYTYGETYYGTDGLNYSSLRFLYPAWPGKKGNNIYISKHLDSINIQGKLYYDVFITAYTSQSYENPIKSEYYCKNTGVIRREFYDGSIWEVIRYHLNK